MIPVTVQTLIVSAAPSPSIIVLQPVEEIVQEGKSRIIPIWVGVNEATQMGIALEKARFSRPMTHDLMTHVIEGLGARIEKVEVTNLKDSTFFAVIHLVTSDDRRVEIDARPSDAIALATAAKAKIYVAEEVLEESAAA